MRRKSFHFTILLFVCLAAFLTTGCASSPLAAALEVIPGVHQAAADPIIDDVSSEELTELVTTVRQDLTLSRARERERLAAIRPAPALIAASRPNYIAITPLNTPDTIEAFAQRTNLLPSLLMPLIGIDPNRLRDTWGASRDGGRRRHRGIDIFAPRGTEIVAVADGYLTFIGDQSKGGHCVWLASDSGYAFYYAHLDRWAPGIYEGMRVNAGELLGFVGTTGNARNSSPHLHFSIHDPSSEAVNPYPLLRFAQIAQQAKTNTATYSGFSHGGTK